MTYPSFPKKTFSYPDQPKAPRIIANFVEVIDRAERETDVALRRSKGPSTNRPSFTRQRAYCSDLNSVQEQAKFQKSPRTVGVKSQAKPAISMFRKLISR